MTTPGHAGHTQGRPSSPTAGPSRAQDPDECAEVQRALSVLGRSWAGAVLWAVLEGARRYGEIRAQLPGISDAVLSARLRDLCTHGLLTRTESPDGRVVTYSPTPVGADTRHALVAVRDLTRRHPQHFT